jgi:hypothetical protein
MAGSNGEPKPRHHMLTVFSAAISPPICLYRHRQVRDNREPQNRESNGSNRPVRLAGRRRRADRIKTECPLSALSGHRLVRCTCLLLPQSGHSKGIKREDDPHLF